VGVLLVVIGATLIGGVAATWGWGRDHLHRRVLVALDVAS
jgi:hypothetical protein